MKRSTLALCIAMAASCIEVSAAEPPVSGSSGIDFAIKTIKINSSKPVVISVRSDATTNEPGNEASVDLWVDGRNVLNHSAKMAFDEKDYILNGPGTFRVLLRCTSFKAVQSGCSIRLKDAGTDVEIQ